MLLFVADRQKCDFRSRPTHNILLPNTTSRSIQDIREREDGGRWLFPADWWQTSKHQILPRAGRTKEPWLWRKLKWIHHSVKSTSQRSWEGERMWWADDGRLPLELHDEKDVMYHEESRDVACRRQERAGSPRIYELHQYRKYLFVRREQTVTSEAPGSKQGFHTSVNSSTGSTTPRKGIWCRCRLRFVK